MIWTLIILSLIIGSFIGAPIVLLTGKKIAKIDSVKFWNSFFVCLISTILIYFFWYIAGETIAKKMIGKIIKGKEDYLLMGALIHVFVSFIFYTIIGKIIWKSNWIKTIIAHIIWVGINALIIVLLLLRIS